MPDLSQIDKVLRLIDREVWIVTASDGTRRGGLLATWISAASIDAQRPVILAGLAPNHFTTELVQKSGVLAAHLLRPDQVHLAWNFARDSGHVRDKLAGLEVTAGITGSPVLADCLVSCEARVFASYHAGDRLFLWADVVAGRLDELSAAGSTPLREKEFFGRLTAEQRQHLVAARNADVAALRALHQRWRLDVRQRPVR